MLALKVLVDIWLKSVEEIEYFSELRHICIGSSNNGDIKILVEI